MIINDADTKPSESGEPSNSESVASQNSTGVSTEKSLRDELRSMIKSLVEETIGDLTSQRKSLDEQSSKFAEVVDRAQGSLMVPDFGGGTSVDYVRRVLAEDAQTRRVSPDGKARYSEKPEDLTKSKIIILKRMGLGDDEIAKALFDN